jgi:hypothetical protein
MSDNEDYVTTHTYTAKLSLYPRENKPSYAGNTAIDIAYPRARFWGR